MGHVILTVDTSAGVRQMVSFTLNGAGYEVVESVKYTDALDKLNDSKIDLVLADLDLPNENASAFLSELKGHPQLKLIPVIVLTTESNTTLKNQYLKAGAAACLEKPFKPDRLVSIVKKFLNNSK